MSPPREPFDWLAERQVRRGSLTLIRTAVRRGWLDGPQHAARRASLVAALGVLVEDPTLRPREIIHIARIFEAMERPDRIEVAAGETGRRRRRIVSGRYSRGEGGNRCAKIAR